MQDRLLWHVTPHRHEVQRDRGDSATKTSDFFITRPYLSSESSDKIRAAPALIHCLPVCRDCYFTSITSATTTRSCQDAPKSVLATHTCKRISWYANWDLNDKKKLLILASHKLSCKSTTRASNRCCSISCYCYGYAVVPATLLVVFLGLGLSD